jgi:hypothetical protein
VEPPVGFVRTGGSRFHLQPQRPLEPEVALSVAGNPDSVAAKQGAQDAATMLGRAIEAAPKLAHAGLYLRRDRALLEGCGSSARRAD